jgi:hypothetical protein
MLQAKELPNLSNNVYPLLPETCYWGLISLELPIFQQAFPATRESHQLEHYQFFSQGGVRITKTVNAGVVKVEYRQFLLYQLINNLLQQFFKNKNNFVYKRCASKSMKIQKGVLLVKVIFKKS